MLKMQFQIQCLKDVRISDISCETRDKSAPELVRARFKIAFFTIPDRRVEMQSTLKVDNPRVRRPMKMQIVHPPPPPATTRPWILFYGDWMSLKTQNVLTFGIQCFTCYHDTMRFVRCLPGTKKKRRILVTSYLMEANDRSNKRTMAKCKILCATYED